MSRIVAARRNLILPGRFRQKQGGYVVLDSYRSGPPAVAHRYWRLLISAVDGSTGFAGFTEIEFRATVGGPSLFTTQTSAVGPVSRSREANLSNAAWRGADLSNTSGWLTDLGIALPHWWSYDFGHAGHVGAASVDVKQVVIKGSYNAPTGSPKDFVLQWSDDKVAWNTVMTVTGETGWTGASDVRTFNV